MKLPRKGILIRLLIYVPLLTFFGYQAYLRYRTEQAVAKEAPELEGRKTKFTLPDGKSVEVVEISEDQARQMGIDPGGKGAEAPAKAAPAGEPPAPQAPPAGAN